MKKPILVLLFALLLTLPAEARDNRPDPILTPGEVATTDLSLVCKHGYSASVRRTTKAMKEKVYSAYKIKKHKNMKIDHLVPLSLGGADTVKNLWPSDFGAGKHNAAAKDRLELKIRDLVCHGKMKVVDGQKSFMTDWQKTYDIYCPTRADCPSYREIQEMKLKDNFHYREKKTKTKRPSRP